MVDINSKQRLNLHLWSTSLRLQIHTTKYYCKAMFSHLFMIDNSLWNNRAIEKNTHTVPSEINDKDFLPPLPWTYSTLEVLLKHYTTYCITHCGPWCQIFTYLFVISNMSWDWQIMWVIIHQTGILFSQILLLRKMSVHSERLKWNYSVCQTQVEF